MKVGSADWFQHLLQCMFTLNHSTYKRVQPLKCHVAYSTFSIMKIHKKSREMGRLLYENFYTTSGISYTKKEPTTFCKLNTRSNHKQNIYFLEFLNHPWALWRKWHWKKTIYILPNVCQKGSSRGNYFKKCWSILKTSRRISSSDWFFL